jgi:hypothetical protein
VSPLALVADQDVEPGDEEGTRWIASQVAPDPGDFSVELIGATRTGAKADIATATRLI